MAGTVIDKLVVSIGLDNSGFTKGLKKVDEDLHDVSKGTEKTGRQLEDVGKKGADSFASFRREAAGALALFTGGAGIIKFTGDIAAANTALGALSRQLDIAPQKLTQLRSAMAATGGNAADIDSAFKSIQAKASTNEGLADLRRLGQLTGVDYIDANGNVRSDIFDQMAHSKQWRGLTRGVQENYAQQLGFSSSVVNLTDRNDYDAIKKRFAGLGPTAQQIRQAEQLNADWEALKANTDQVMQRFFSDLEPTVDKFIQSLIALEKANPEKLAKGLEALAAVITAITSLLTLRGLYKTFKMVSTLGGLISTGEGTAVASSATAAGALGALSVGAGAVGLLASSPVSADDKNAISSGNSYEDLVRHYKERTGSLSAWGFDEAEERSIVNQESHPFTPSQDWMGALYQNAERSASLLPTSGDEAYRDIPLQTNTGNEISLSALSNASVPQGNATNSVVNNTTHSPTITVNVNGGSGSPDDIRRMAQKGVASALDRHDAGKVG